jgi:hypothetical protein
MLSGPAENRSEGRRPAQDRLHPVSAAPNEREMASFISYARADKPFVVRLERIDGPVGTDFGN